MKTTKQQDAEYKKWKLRQKWGMQAFRWRFKHSPEWGKGCGNSEILKALNK